MSSIKWIKLNVDMFDDEKIKIIQSMPEGDSLLIVWIKLITLAGKTNDGGYIYINENMAYTEEMLSVIMNKPLNIIQLALGTFTRLGMIELDDKGIYLINFEKYQSIEKLERLKEQNRERVRRFREKKKNETLHVMQCNAIDIDIDKEEDIDIDSSSSIYDYYENEIGSLSPRQYEILNNYLDVFPEELIKEAINKTSDSNAKSFNYMNKILTDWKSKGYKTLGDVQNEIKPIKKSAKQIKQENEDEVIKRFLNEEE